MFKCMDKYTYCADWCDNAWCRCPVGAWTSVGPFDPIVMDNSMANALPVRELAEARFALKWNRPRLVTVYDMHLTNNNSTIDSTFSVRLDVKSKRVKLISKDIFTVGLRRKQMFGQPPVLIWVPHGIYIRICRKYHADVCQSISQDTHSIWMGAFLLSRTDKETREKSKNAAIHSVCMHSRWTLSHLPARRALNIEHALLKISLHPDVSNLFCTARDCFATHTIQSNVCVCQSVRSAKTPQSQ